MRLERLSKTSLLFLLAIVISGCSLPVVGGKCTYNTITSYAVVKELKEEHVVLAFYTQKLSYVNTEFHERSLRLPSVHVGEILPADFYYITEGSCTPEGFTIKREEYFSIKNTIILFSDDEGKIEENADKKLNRVAQNFLSLKKEYPEATLTLYGRASRGSDDYRFGTLIWYANAVKNGLLEKGLNKESIHMLPFDDDTTMDFLKPLPKNRVTFTLELGVKKKI